MQALTCEAARRSGLGPVVLFAAACWIVLLGSAWPRAATCCVLVSEFLALRDLWTSTGALPRDLALAVADDAPQEDAGAFFTKAGIFIGARWEAVTECTLRFSQLPHRESRPDSQMPPGLEISSDRSRPPSLLPSCPPCASRLPLGKQEPVRPCVPKPASTWSRLASQVNRLLVKRMTVAQAPHWQLIHFLGGPVGLATAGNFDRLTVR